MDEEAARVNGGKAFVSVTDKEWEILVVVVVAPLKDAAAVAVGSSTVGNEWRMACKISRAAESRHAGRCFRQAKLGPRIQSINRCNEESFSFGACTILAIWSMLYMTQGQEGDGRSMAIVSVVVVIGIINVKR